MQYVPVRPHGLQDYGTLGVRTEPPASDISLADPNLVMEVDEVRYEVCG